jgi:hypothetical protein
MPKRYARKSPSKKSARIESSDTLDALEQKVMAIAEKLGRIAATVQEKTDVGRARARQQSRKKVAAPGKKHRKAPEAAHGVKHSDELISKALTTRRRRSGRPREG